MAAVLPRNYVRILPLPHDSQERRRVLVGTASAVVEVLGTAAALALIAEVEEQIAEPERVPAVVPTVTTITA